MQDLKPFRDRIDNLDEKIITLLGERFGIIREVARLKSKQGIPSYLPDRVEEVKDRCADMGAKVGLDRELVKTIYTLIIANAVSLEDIKIKENDK